MLAGAFSSIDVHYIICTLMRAAQRWRSGHERLRDESIMSRDVFLSRTHTPYIVYIILHYYMRDIRILFIERSCCCLDCNRDDVATCPSCPKTILSRSVIKTQNATAIYYIILRIAVTPTLRSVSMDLYYFLFLLDFTAVAETHTRI